MRYYAGIGKHKDVPDGVIYACKCLATIFEELGYILRSGGAPGCDSAFESGVTKNKNKQIFLPWKGFNGNKSSFVSPSINAENLSRVLFPHWQGISRGARLLTARNVHQIYGPEIGISPLSEFVIYWSPKSDGGTGRTLKIAKDANSDMPLYNLADPHDVIRLHVFIEDLKKPNS